MTKQKGNQLKGIQKMEIKRSGSQPSGKGPAEYFTGTVRVDPLFQAKDPARALGASVTFEPSARTAWHTHPLGQTLIVTAGCGRVQRWGGPIEEIRPGDVVRIAPDFRTGRPGRRIKSGFLFIFSDYQLPTLGLV